MTPISRKAPLSRQALVYFGIPVGALALAEAGHPPRVAIVGPLDMPGRRRLRKRLPTTLLLGLPDASDAIVEHALQSVRPTRILSYFYPRKVPPNVLAMAPAMGTHPSLLPRWRGPDPYFWTIQSGDLETGVTLHRLEADYDTGAVLETRTLKVRSNETAWSLARRLDRLALPLIVSAATRDDVQGVPQQGAMTQAPLPTEADLTLAWSEAASTLERKVRAAAPFGAYATLGEEDVNVVRARVIPTGPKGLRPGEAWKSNEGWAVCCGVDALLLQRVEQEGQRIDPETCL